LAKLTSAIICDYAQVRDGLLFMMSGSITRVFRPDLPAPMGVMLALVMEVPAGEQDQVHEVNVAVKHAGTASEVFRLAGGAQVAGAVTYPGESIYVPMVIDLRMVNAGAYGAFDVVSSVDDNPGPHLTIYVVDKQPS
jgi:hypothetical protein